MKKTVLWASLVFWVVLIGIAFLPGKQNTLHAAASGWTNILPAPTLEGWTRVMIPPDRPRPEKSQWSVANGRVICAGNGGHEWLRYDRELKDFLFHVEWRLTKQAGNPNYNSGVFVRNDAKGLIWYQAQVGSASGGYFFGDNPENGSLRHFDLLSALTKQAVKPAGEWNTYDIRCQGRKLVLRVNGVVTSELDNCNHPRGYLGLEAEGSRIEFRNLRIKALD
jgi:3-keto-disaccharide hydrolase